MTLHTMQDLAVPGHVEDARHQLNRAIDRGDEAALAAWARRWGRGALERAEAAAGAEAVSDEISRFKSSDITDVEHDIRNALKALEAVTEFFESDTPNAIRDRADRSLVAAIELIDGLDLCGIEL